MKIQKFFSLSIILFLCTHSLFSDSFRVKKVHIAQLELTTKDELQCTCSINDAVAVSLPEDKVFLEGIEFKMNIPEGIASWPDSVAASIYGKTVPRPETSQIDYSGNRIFVKTLPARLSWILQVPVTKQNSIKTNNYATLVENIPDISNNFVFLRFQTVMKGLQEETMNSRINVTIKPLLADKGRVVLNLTSSDKILKPVSVYVDDILMENDKDIKNIIVSTGIHNVSIVSDDYRNEFRTIYVDQAKNTDVNIELKGVDPTIKISAPQGTKVFLDGKAVTDFENQIIISEGEHSIKCTVGDYEIVRSVKAEKGKTYRVNFEVALTISDED